MEALEQRIAPAAISISLGNLNGVNGFELVGETSGNSPDTFVSEAGDVNGDGFGDFMIGSPSGDLSSSSTAAAYVIFGKATGFLEGFDLSTLNGFNGFEIVDGKLDRSFGRVVSGAGDFNGDGFGDIIIGSPDAHSQGLYSGAAFVVFGRADWSATPLLDVSELDGENGLRLSGSMGGNNSLGDHLGSAVSGAGDVNGDGFDDVAVRGRRGGSQGAALADSYIIFGSRNDLPPELNVSDLNGVNGFRITGVPLSGLSTGGPVAGAGDLNGDGFDDVVIGQGSAYESGGAYVVFGKPSGFLPDFDVSTLDGANGFVLMGDEIGSSVSRAGDVNGDGIDDLLLGAPSDRARGTSYVVFGKGTLFARRFDVSEMTSNDGLRIVGPALAGQFGQAVSDAGDFNGDGIDDLLVSAPFIPIGGQEIKDAVCLIFGSLGGFGAEMRVTRLNATEGFQLVDEPGFISTGVSVSSAGDINNDGLSDIIIGNLGASPGGSSYVVFGAPGVQINPTTVVLKELDGDVVTIEVSGRSLSPQDIKRGGNGNLVIDLRHLPSLQQDGADEKSLNLKIGVKTPAGSTADGLTNVDLIDARGLELGKVRVEGDLGQILAGNRLGNAAVRSLKVDGDLGISGGTRDSQLLGTVGRLQIGGSVQGSSVHISGKVDVVVIHGDLIGNTPGATAPENSVQGSPATGKTIPSGVLLADGIGSLHIGGDMMGSNIVTTKDLGSLSVCGDFSNSRVFSGGRIGTVELGTMSSDYSNSPATLIARDKMDSLLVAGNVKNTRILVGYDESERPVNPDAQVGKIVVKGDWLSSSLVAGISDDTNDGYGRNDVVIPGDLTRSTFSRIASITIKGVAHGSVMALDHFGITAQQIGRLKIDGESLRFSKDLPDDILLDESNFDFRVVEVQQDQISGVREVAARLRSVPVQALAGSVVLRIAKL